MKLVLKNLSKQPFIRSKFGYESEVISKVLRELIVI